jgi:hypothetical protein
MTPILVAIALQLTSLGQSQDRVIYQGKTHPLLAAPLESNPARATDLPAGPPSCRPGYWAKWELGGGRLRLMGLFACGAKEGGKAPASHPIPGAALPLHATWFTGVLPVATGKPIKEGRDEYVLVAVHRGRVVAERRVDYRARLKATDEQPPSKTELDAELAKATPLMQRCEGAPASVAVEVQDTPRSIGPTVKVMAKVPAATASCLAAAIQVAAPLAPRARAYTARATIKLTGRVTLRGRAVDSKGGAVVVTQSGPVYILGLDSWKPLGLDGKQVTVTGFLRKTKLIPDPVQDKNGEISQGAIGEQQVLDGATWRAK